MQPITNYIDKSELTFLIQSVMDMPTIPVLIELKVLLL